MADELDYKNLYETLMDAIDEANRILLRAQVATAISIHVQKGEDVPDDLLDFLAYLKDST